MDRLGRWRITKPVAWVLLYILPISAAIFFYLFFTDLGILLSPRGAAVISYVRTISPLANLGLPGINPYLPIVDGYIALIIGMVVHEGAHGVIARSLGIPVKSAGLGLFLGFIPLIAFVDIDEEHLKTARSSQSLRILAGGAGTNFVVGLFCLVLLLASVSSMVPAATGAGIINVGTGTPAANAGLKPGDIVTQLNGHQVSDLSVYLGAGTNFTAGQSINLTVYRDGRTFAVNNVTLACCNEIINTTTNAVIEKYPYIGVSQISYSTLQAIVAQYATPSLSAPSVFQFLCIPSFPVCQERVPFSDALSVFYTSPLGSSGPQVTNLLYWIFFFNVNLAIFNSIPIFPLDGGQAFRVGVKALGRGRLSDRTVMAITGAATVATLLLFLTVAIGPYLF